MSDPINPYAELFANPQGPGDARPTALQIIRDNDLFNQWTGKVALVTGATSGLGLETARALHATGADIFITARDFRKAQVVIEDILKSSEGSGKIELVEMDMNSLASVKKGAQAFLAKSSTLNILINNAGVMATPEGTKTADGFEQQFGVNHLAHFTLTAMLLPTLIRSSTPEFNSRVVTLTSSGHKFSSINFEDVNLTDSYNPWLGYGQSKTANIWLANYIDRVYGPRGVHASSVNPGGAYTGLQQHVQDMAEGWKSDPVMAVGMQSSEQGAATTVWAAAAKAWEGKGGKYLTDCGVGKAAEDLMAIADPGYGPHAYDEEGENKLWELSIKLTGVKVEE